jgi:hypothetical protein
MRSFTKYNKGNQVKEDELGGACRMHGRDKKLYTIFLSGKLKGRDNLEDIGVDRNTILEGNKVGRMEWMHLAQDSVDKYLEPMFFL